MILGVNIFGGKVRVASAIRAGGSGGALSPPVGVLGVRAP